MKIGQVSLQFEATTTGGGVHVEQVTEHLLRKGHEVSILSIHSDKTLAEATLTKGPVAHSVDSRNGLRVVRFLVERGLSEPYGGGGEEELARIKRFCDAFASRLLVKNKVVGKLRNHYGPSTPNSWPILFRLSITGIGRGMPCV